MFFNILTCFNTKLSTNLPKCLFKDKIRMLFCDRVQPYMENKEPFLKTQLVSKEPFKQFLHWHYLAKSMPESIPEPNAMCLATATKQGIPSCRMVLLKGVSEKGFKFTTNYNSRKAQEIAENPFVALNFFWEPLMKVVRIEGTIEKLSADESKDYFYARPVASQISAVISPQSQIIESKNVLDMLECKMKHKYANGNKVALHPSLWGGYVVVPEVVEFWQGQPSRLHDRIRFRKLKANEIRDCTFTHLGENGWIYERLAP